MQYQIGGATGQNGQPQRHQKNSRSFGHPGTSHQVQRGSQNFQNLSPQDQLQYNIHYSKQLAAKGATGRKASLPSNYNQQVVQTGGQNKVSGSGSVLQSQAIMAQSHVYQNMKNLKQGQMMMNKQGSGDPLINKQTSKIIKSHAKYFSQQNSPVNKQKLQQLYANPILPERQSQGRVMIQHQIQNTNNSVYSNNMNTMDKIASQNGGNFGTVSHQVQSQSQGDFSHSQPRKSQENRRQQIQQNYSHQNAQKQTSGNYLKNQQIPSKYSNSNNFEDQYLIDQQQLQNFHQGRMSLGNQPTNYQLTGLRQNSNASLANPGQSQPQQYIKQYHSTNQGPVISNVAGQQTVATVQSQMHGTQTIHSQETLKSNIQSLHNSQNIQKNKKRKQKYDESFLNTNINVGIGELNADDTIVMANEQSMLTGIPNTQGTKRYFNNKSQIVENFDEQKWIPEAKGITGHKRMLSTQNSYVQNHFQQRANTAIGNQSQVNSNQPMSHMQMSKTEMRFLTKNQPNKFSKNKSQQKYSVPQGDQLQKSQGQINSGFTVTQSGQITNVSLQPGLKNGKRPYKASTRPSSNQKNKTHLIQNQSANNSIENLNQKSQIQISNFDIKQGGQPMQSMTSNQLKPKKIKSQMTVAGQTGKPENIKNPGRQSPRILIVPQNPIMSQPGQQQYRYNQHQFYDNTEGQPVHQHSNSQQAIVVTQGNFIPAGTQSQKSYVPVQQPFNSQTQNNKLQHQMIDVPRTISHQNSTKIASIGQAHANNYYEQENQTIHVQKSANDSKDNALTFSMKKQQFKDRTGEFQMKFQGKERIGTSSQMAQNQIRQGSSNQNSIQSLHSQQRDVNSSLAMYNNGVGSNNFESNKISNLQYQQTKSQKSSTSRLVQQNSKGSKQNQKASMTAGSTDRIPHTNQIGLIQHSDPNQNSHHQFSENFIQATGGIQSTSSKNSLNQIISSQGRVLNDRGPNPSYPYQSTSTKSVKVISQDTKKTNGKVQQNSMSIAQIFQQKGLNYKGPSKVVNQQNNAQKMKNKINSNGVIVRDAKASGPGGAKTTSANTAVNTAKNSPRIFNNKNSLYNMNKNQGSVSSARRKPSATSIMSKGNQQPTITSVSNMSQRQQIQNSQMSNGYIQMTDRQTGKNYQKNNSASKVKGMKNMSPDFDDSHIQATEVAYEQDSSEYKYMKEIQPSKLNSKLAAGNYHQYMGQLQRSDLSVQQQQQIQSAPQFMDGGTGSNPNLIKPQQSNYVYQQNPNSQAMTRGHTANQQSVQQQRAQNNNSHQDLYSNKIKQKPNSLHQHSNSVGGVYMNSNQNHQIPQVSQKFVKQPNPVQIVQQQKIQKKGQQILKNIQGPPSKAKNDKYQDLEFEFQDQIEFQDFNQDNINLNYPEGPLITEEEEQEIRQVASDINEKAFYGKVMRAKQLINNNYGNQDSAFKKLSPRSQEIAYVMNQVSKSFKNTEDAPETTLDFYRIGKMLGRGAFGKVNLAMHKMVRKLVALKSLNKECLTDEVQKQKLMKEVNLLLKLRHDHVVKIYETIETKKHIIIVMELCAGGDLLNYVRKRRRLKEPFAKKIFKQIIDGLRYIHSKHVAHRDIKLDNILLDGKGSVKIADFGVSKQCQPGVKMREQCGTPAYIAPEILKNKNGYSFNVDLWSAGVVLFAMLYGTVPFKASSMDELHSLILRGVYLLKDDISQEARDMLRGLLEINPHKRLNFEQIYAHPWLQDYDESLQLFNDQEREMIKKEYTYNDPSRYNRNENEDPVDCFTEHNIDSVYNTLKNCSEKSIILAPFNSTQSEDMEMFKAKIKPMMVDKQLVLRLSRLCREVDRQYEFNNNGQLDNGVYHKQIANSDGDKKSDDGSDKEKNKKKKKDSKEDTDDEDDEAKFQVIQCTKEDGLEFLTEDYRDENLKEIKKENKEAFMNNLLGNMTEAERQLIESTFGTNHDVEIDSAKVQRLEQFGYPHYYVLQSLQDNRPNYCTAGYYLLKMDQNYC